MKIKKGKERGCEEKEVYGNNGKQMRIINKRETEHVIDKEIGEESQNKEKEMVKDTADNVIKNKNEEREKQTRRSLRRRKWKIQHRVQWPNIGE